MNEIAKMAGITFEAELGYVGKADDLETGKAEVGLQIRMKLNTL